MRLRLLLIFLFVLGCIEAHTQDKAKEILLLGLDSTQFYSDAFYLDSLANAYALKPDDIPKMHSIYLEKALANYFFKGYYYLTLDRSTVDSIRSTMAFSTQFDKEIEEYLGIIPLTRDQSILQNEIAKQESDYLLSINLYEILALKDSTNFGDEVLHVIHFDLFDNNMKMVNSGKFQTSTTSYLANEMSWFYKDFALDQIFWIKAYENDPEKLEENYSKQVDSYFNDITSNKYVGINAGVGMPLGGIGIEIGQLFKDDWEWNGGMGYDFSGLKLGGGIKYYVLGASGFGSRPFVALNYSFSTGNKFNIGGEKDEFGNQIAPDDVTWFQIFSDHAIHLRAGLNIILDKDLAINPTIGYAFAFSRKPIELLRGPDKNGRTNFAQFLAVGGLELGVSILIYYR